MPGNCVKKLTPVMLVVTIRGGEERGMCSAALRELLRFVKDQIEERGVVVVVTNRESAMWRKASFENCAARESTELRRR